MTDPATNLTCSFCKRVLPDEDFTTRTGATNRRQRSYVCRDCNKAKCKVDSQHLRDCKAARKAYDPISCPLCGSKLVITTTESLNASTQASSCTSCGFREFAKAFSTPLSKAQEGRR